MTTTIADITPETITPEIVFREAALARPRISWIQPTTPLDKVVMPGGGEVLVKREDACRVHSFKWRGAANRIAAYIEAGGTGPITTASAGNHAQGVALAARSFGLESTIFMPLNAPDVKLRAVRALGGDSVTVVQRGDNFDECNTLMQEYSIERGAERIVAYDDPLVIAGQGTIGDELALQTRRPGRVFIAIGGGGLAAGVASVLSMHWPGTEFIGVEAVGQASMSAAFEAGAPVTLRPEDSFADGTAVGRAGRFTLPICRRLLSRIEIVTRDEICAAIEFLWGEVRAIPEPSGAMAMAAIMRDPPRADGPPDATIMCGANLDFMTIPRIAARSHIGLHVRRHYEFTIDERSGSLVEILERIGDEYNIVDFQYGKTDERVAHPVIGFESSRDRIARLDEIVGGVGVPARDVSSRLLVEFRTIPYRADLFKRPMFAVISFPDRGGALREFMHRVGAVASICYFNFASTGEMQGQALMGFEFKSAGDRAAFEGLLAESGVKHELLRGDGMPFEREERADG